MLLFVAIIRPCKSRDGGMAGKGSAAAAALVGMGALYAPCTRRVISRKGTCASCHSSCAPRFFQVGLLIDD